MNDLGYYYEPNDTYYKTKQELVDAWNEDFVDFLIDEPYTIDSWTEEQWKTNWIKKEYKDIDYETPF